jgi:hypothetical protein
MSGFLGRVFGDKPKDETATSPAPRLSWLQRL